MEIPLNVEVDCSDGRCGRSTYVIVDPITREVTHVVVRDEHRPHTERLVATTLIVEGKHDGIKLSCSSKELQDMAPFFTTEFIQADIPHFDAVNTYLWPYMTSTTKREYIQETTENLPAHTRDVRRGAHVDATDGRVGRVDEFVVEPSKHVITHLVMREGHLWGAQDVSIPVSQIDFVEEDTVHLKLDKAGVEELPILALHRP